MNYDILLDFEDAVSRYTGAPYVVLTDCATHAIELAMRYEGVSRTTFTNRTYLSIPMLMHKLEIAYALVDDQWQNEGEYHFDYTRIWDSACKFAPNMYRPHTMQCVSFGPGKPFSLGLGGAILMDSNADYIMLRRMAYDGRDLSIKPWEAQEYFEPGYHYGMRLETAAAGLEKLPSHATHKKVNHYPDLRKINIGG